MKKGIIAAIAILIVGGGVYFYLKEVKPELFLNIEEMPAPEVTVDTSDWKEFRSEKFGIAFKTPPDWNNVETDDAIGLNYLGHDSFGSIRFDMRHENEKDFIDSIRKGALITKSKISYFKMANRIIFDSGGGYYIWLGDRGLIFNGGGLYREAILYSLQII